MAQDKDIYLNKFRQKHKDAEYNRRNNHYIEYKGKIYTLTQLARKFNIRYDKLYSRLFNYPFWTIERALTTP